MTIDSEIDSEIIVDEEDSAEIEQGDSTLESRVAVLETAVAVMVWLFAELIWKTKKAAAQHLLNNPEVQEQLEKFFISRMD